ncbi:GDP-mannose 4,6-dehydratase [Paraflavisolibacter sp. H34]|uniref:GDP-mannose 4,6-dehydratase n=1 Tax=Huijunlia imazamoxiresistens TaxID=3127457 RepID=UPI003019C4C7
MNQFQKHYLVTGGAGFIGSHVIKSLLKDESVRVTCIDNFDPFYKRAIKLENIAPFKDHPNFRLLELDLDQPEDSLEEALPGPLDAIIHLAARAGVRPSIENPMAYVQTNIVGTQRLLDLAVEKKVKKFVFASSSSVYGVNKNLPWQEDEKLQPISPYAMTKLSGEMAGHVYNKLYNLPFIALRFFTVYGPAQRPDLAIHNFVKSVYNEQPIKMFGDGSTSRDYTYVDDIVQGILGALHYDKTSFEIINLGNSDTISLKELIEAIEETVGKKAIINRLPEQPGDVPHTYADVSKAKALLNYQPHTHIREGLRHFYQWFLQNREVLVH